MIKCSLEGLLNGSNESLQKTFELEEKVNDAESKWMRFAISLSF